VKTTPQTQDAADGASGKTWKGGGLPAGAEVQPAGLGRLWAAALLDATLGLGLWALCAQAVLTVRDLPGNPLALPRAVLPGLLALAVLLHLVYHVFCVGRFGKTLGKRMMRIEIVRCNGSPAGYGKALLRSVGGMASVLTLGLANLGVLVRKDRRGAGDWLAGTCVIRVSRP